MATTRIIPMHRNTGQTIAQSLRHRIDYAINPNKTEHGELVSTFGCSAENADAEFELYRWNYEHHAKHVQKSNVIAYQIRQSFKPNEVTPEEANKIGCELADRFLKKRFPYVVATHTDKAHIQ